MMDVFLETECLILRRFTEGDADNLHQLDADPAVMRYINGGKATPRETIVTEKLPEILDRYRRDPAFGYWAAIEKASGEFVGWFALHPVEDRPAGEMELGYRLRQSAWGKGYATEGARSLIDRGFSEPGVERVFAQTMTVNRGSRRVMEKCGMRYVRTFFLDWPEVIEGTEQGDVEYVLERDEWEREKHEIVAPAERNRRKDRG